ncbi:DUF6389 family protein [Cellulosimicrobium cellulans]
MDAETHARRLRDHLDAATPDAVRRLPLVAPGRAAFDARDLVVDTAAAWVVEVWDAAARGRSRPPGRVEGHDGYGTRVPLALEP